MYLLDTSVFINAYWFHYGFDFHLDFWEWLLHADREGRVFSIDRVFEEILRKEDQLNGWAYTHKNEFFLGPPSDLNSQLEVILDYLRSENYRDISIDEISDSADVYLIAYALSSGFKVVTHEVQKSRKGKMKIPSVCESLNVDCITPFEMLRRERARFVWQPSE